MLRQKQKELRCQAVLDAAEQLIRETGSAGFSMLKLAERAQMSSMTPYNLFGTKGAILYALLNRSLDDIFTGGEPAMTHPDPFEQALLAATAAVDFFIADPEYYRPLYQFLLGVSEPVYRPAYMARALEFWRRAFTGLQARGHLGSHVSRDELAQAFVVHFVGMLDLWVQSEIEHDEFRRRIQRDAGLLLLSIAQDAPTRSKLVARIRAIRPQKKPK